MHRHASHYASPHGTTRNQHPNPWECPVLTPTELAPILRITTGTVHRRINAGQIPCINDPATAARRIPTTWVYERLGLPIPDRPVAA